MFLKIGGTIINSEHVVCVRLDVRVKRPGRYWFLPSVWADGVFVQISNRGGMAFPRDSESADAVAWWFSRSDRSSYGSGDVRKDESITVDLLDEFRKFGSSDRKDGTP